MSFNSMLAKQPHCECDLGNGSNLTAFSIDPRISEADLAQLLSSAGNKGVKPLDALAKDTHLIAKFDSLSDLKIEVLPERYTIPKQLLPYKQALYNKLIKKGKENNDVIVAKGDIKIPLTITRAGYFDFMATKLTEVPSELLPSIYPANKTIGELLQEYRLRASDMARFLGFGFIVMPSNGKEISFVQRAKGLGIATGVMSLSGMTPYFHEDFLKESFDFHKYFKDGIARELDQEYKLLPHEYKIGRGYFVYNKEINQPIVAVEIITHLSTEEIARKIFGDENVIQEHSILYSVGIASVGTLIRRFELGISAYIMDIVAKDRRH